MTLIFPLAIPAAIILGMVAFVWIAISTLKKLKSDSETIKSLRTELGKSSKALEKAYAQIKDMQREIDSLKTPKIPQEDYPLETKYWQLLEMIQNIDYASHLIDTPVGKSLRQLTEQTLELYGYEFVDFSDATKNHYICEYQPITEIKVTSRAIRRKGGKTALEGKVFIPEN